MIRKLLTLAMALFLALAGAGMAAGQIADDAALGEEEAGLGVEEEALATEDAALTEQVPFEEFFAVGLEDPSAAQDFEYDAERNKVVDKEIDMTEEKLFNLLAIANQDEFVGDEIGFEDAADLTVTQRLDQSADAQSDFEEETVFAALAVGFESEVDELETLAGAGGNVARDLTVERTAIQDIDLPREDTLFAIALANSAGGELDWRDPADIHREVITDVSADQEVDLTTEDAFLALALGITAGDDLGEEEGILGGEEVAAEEGLVAEEEALGAEEEAMNGILGGEEVAAEEGLGAEEGIVGGEEVADEQALIE